MRRILVQPWFSDPAGHPATTTLGLWRRIKDRVRCEVVVHRAKWGRQGHLADYAAEMNARPADSPAWMGRWMPNQICGSFGTVRVLKRMVGAGTAQVLFHDANIYSLALALLASRWHPTRLTAIVLSAPEVYMRGSLGRWGKWPLISWLIRRSWFRVCCRTEEMADAWMRVMPRELQVTVLPSIEFFGLEPVQRVHERKGAWRKYFVGGQIRRGKSVAELCDIFSGPGAPGQLTIAGMCVSLPLLERFAALQHCPSIVIQNEFLAPDRFRRLLAENDYNVMLYQPWDPRMEASMLYMAIFSGCPTICFEGGWLARRVKELGVGWIVPRKNLNKLGEIIRSVPGPESEAYLRTQDAIVRAQALLRDERLVDSYLTAIGWSLQ